MIRTRVKVVDASQVTSGRGKKATIKSSASFTEVDASGQPAPNPATVTMNFVNFKVQGALVIGQEYFIDITNVNEA